MVPVTGPVKKDIVSKKTSSGLVLFIPEDFTPSTGKFSH